MKNFKRMMVGLLMLVMLMVPVAMAASVTDFVDFPDDWSTEAMTAAVKNGLYIGNGNGTIEPSRQITRAEFAAFVVRAFGATIETDISNFDDVSEDDWFYHEVSKAVHMGAMIGTSETTFEPQKSITREEVFTALGRILYLFSDNTASFEIFSDSAKVSYWAEDRIAGLVEGGYIDGYPDGTLRPLDNMTRAELAQMFHNLFKTYIDTPGYHTYVESEGSVIVRSPGAHLENVEINGDLVVADGVGAGNFDVNSVKVNGRILFRGGEGYVTFKKVTSAGKVIIYDRNGTVNFMNYRDEVPFVNNLIEETPATFLVRRHEGGGVTGGGTRPPVTAKYHVTFNGVKADGTAFDSQTVDRGDVAENPGNAYKEGHTFVYWAEYINGEYVEYDFSRPVEGELTLYPVFEINKYEIKFNGVKADGTAFDSQTVEYGNNVTNPGEAYKEGYTFKHWSTTVDGEAYDFTTPVTGEMTLYPVFEINKYTVTFVGEKADGSAFDSQTVEYGNTATNPGYAYKSGYEFKHWSLAVDGAEYDFTTPVTDNITLYAVFEQLPANTYTVAFVGKDANGNDFDPQTVTEGGFVTNPGEAYKEGYTFKYWSTTVDGTEYDFTTPVTGEMTLYPVFEINKYTVTFEGEKADGSAFDSQTVEYGNTATNPGDAYKPGYEFKHWSLAVDGTEYDFATPVTDNITLYAVFELIPVNMYTVSFVGKDVNGNDFDSQTITAGECATNPGNAYKPGYEFKYWSLTVNGAEYDFTTPVTGNITLFAVFEQLPANTYTVAFIGKDINGDDFDVQTITEGGFVTNPGEAYKEGYTFKYWSLAVDGTEYDFSTPVNGNITLYAVFEVNKYTVSFYFEDYCLGTVDVEYGDTVDEADIPWDDLLDEIGYQKNGTVDEIYDGENFDHILPKSYWYIVDGNWTKFDETVVVTKDINAYVNYKLVTLNIDAPLISDEFELVMYSPYDEDVRLIDTIKDMIFINEPTVVTGYNMVEDNLMNQLNEKLSPSLGQNIVEKNAVTGNYDILNFHKEIYLVDVLGEAKIEEEIWEFVGDQVEEDAESWIRDNFVIKYAELTSGKKAELIDLVKSIFEIVMSKDDISQELTDDIVDIVYNFFMTMEEDHMVELVNHYFCNRIKSDATGETKEIEIKHVKDLIKAILKTFKNQNAGKLKEVLTGIIIDGDLENIPVEGNEDLVALYVSELVETENFDIFADAFVNTQSEDKRHSFSGTVIHELLALTDNPDGTNDRQILREIIEELVEEMFCESHIDTEFVEYFLDHLGDADNDGALNSFIKFIKDLDASLLGEISAILGEQNTSKRLEYIDQLIYELINKEYITITDSRLFMFEPILKRLGNYDFSFVESLIPEKLKKFLPMEHIEKLFTRFYDSADYGFVAELKADMEAVKGKPDAMETMNSGIVIMLNPVSDIFVPAIEYALDMKLLADGKLAQQFPTYYSYYKENKYADRILEIASDENTWFDGVDEGFAGELSGYSVRDIEDYYKVIKALAVLTDDAMLYYYNEVPAADREAVLEVASTKMFEIINLFKNIVAEYATNGIPTTLKDFILSIEENPELVEYLEKFGLDAYLDKIAENKLVDTGYEAVADKFGAKIEALLEKVASKLDKELGEAERQQMLETINALFTLSEDNVYSVDTLFDVVFGGTDEKVISTNGITATIVKKDFVYDTSIAQ